ncbi:unknown [Firmicutes bacterium CAG:822]|nr:unknown [Firmicutes bacterium CAG:822]
MGLKVKSNRNENDVLSFKIDDIDFTFSFDNIDKKIKLNEKSTILLKEAVEGDRRLSKNKKKIVAGDYEIKLNSSEEVNNLWIVAFDKLTQYKLIEKEGKEYVVTSKGMEHYKTL